MMFTDFMKTCDRLIAYLLPRYLDPMYCPCLEAKIPSVLRYLDGCKHFDPKGRWVRTLAGVHVTFNGYRSANLNG